MKNQHTIAVVDDSRVARMMIRAIVNDRFPDWTVIEAGSGEELLTQIDNTVVDYFSIDLNMPGMDGVELMKKIKPILPEAKMVLMTANAQEAIMKKVEAQGGIVIPKPITEESVAMMLEYFNG